MIDIWKNAKKEQEILYFKNFQIPEITWEDTLNYIYDLSLIEDKTLHQRIKGQNDSMIVYGGVLFNYGYLLFNDNDLFKKFKGVTEFMNKVNDGISGENCIYYTPEHRGNCSCGAYWHIQALRFSISNHSVSNHNDPNDVLYWQLLGNSRWVMNNKDEYILEPGDLLYFNQEDSHQVFQNGPRAGIIIDSKKPLKNIGEKYDL